MTGLIVKAIVVLSSGLSQIHVKWASFTRKEQGATSVEYVLLVGLIAVAIIVAVALFGTTMKNAFFQVTCAVRGETWDAASSTCSA